MITVEQLKTTFITPIYGGSRYTSLDTNLHNIKWKFFVLVEKEKSVIAGLLVTFILKNKAKRDVLYGEISV